MKATEIKGRFTLIILSLLAVIFGLVTLKSGAFALFGGAAGEQFAGKYVPLVLWFNFAAGFFYVAAGLGIYLRKKWAVNLAKYLAFSTIFVFAGLGVFIFSGGEYEIRTVGAMIVRSAFWVLAFFISKNKIY